MGVVFQIQKCWKESGYSGGKWEEVGKSLRKEIGDVRKEGERERNFFRNREL